MRTGFDKGIEEAARAAAKRVVTQPGVDARDPNTSQVAAAYKAARTAGASIRYANELAADASLEETCKAPGIEDKRKK